MAHDPDTKTKLRQLYVFDQLSLEKAAQQAGVSYPTARRWKYQAKDFGDDWDKVRAAHTMAGTDIEDLARQIMTGLVLEFKTTMSLLASSQDIDPRERVELLTSLSDSYNKAVSANKKLMPETTRLAVALQVVEMLANYIEKEKPELLMAFMEVLQPFGQLLEKELK